MKNVLVTGGAGNIGSSLVKRLVESGSYYVVVLDNLITGSKYKLPISHPDRWEFVKANVNKYRDVAEVMLARRFEYVFHFAAMVGVKRTQNQPLKVLEDIQGIRNILDLSKNTSVKRVFYSSSSEVYGEPVHIPQNEFNTPLNSRVPYAVVKNVGESYLKSYFKEYGLNYTIFRFFNTYGPQQSRDFVITRFLSAALKNEPIPVYGDGSQSRTFCYIDDNIDTIIKCLEGELFINDILNIGSNKVTTILELANLILKLTGSQSKIEFLPPLLEGDMRRRQPDNERMKRVLGRELIGLEEGIKKMLNHKESILFHENN
jgi:UDP-glucuronate decarboxylase